MSPIIVRAVPCSTVECDVCKRKMQGADGELWHFAEVSEARETARDHGWLPALDGQMICFECAEECHEIVGCPKCEAKTGERCAAEPICHPERVEAYAVKMKSEANQ